VTWDYRFARRAERDLDDVSDKDDRKRILEALDGLVTDLAPSGADVVKLGSSGNQWRLRVGRWRLIFERDTQAQLILVLRVLPRSEGTYRRRR
jgi:mRNA-degrading endonuclease RelE of RelBE toxin-antitoxin system